MTSVGRASQVIRGAREACRLGDRAVFSVACAERARGLVSNLSHGHRRDRLMTCRDEQAPQIEAEVLASLGQALQKREPYRDLALGTDQTEKR